MSDSIDYAALFGIEELGAEEQETADPAEDTTEPEGAEEQEIADPAEGSEENEAAGESPDESEESSEEESGGQSKEENARYAAARRKAEAEREKLEAQKAAADIKVAEQLKEIGKLDPTVKTLEDLSKTPTYHRLYELVRDNGLTLVDAFKLANMDALTQGAATVAKQAAMNAINGKKHMEQTRQRGAGAISVPTDVMEEYRKLLPDATDEEIRADYAKRHRQ